MKDDCAREEGFRQRNGRFEVFGLSTSQSVMESLLLRAYKHFTPAE